MLIGPRTSFLVQSSAHCRSTPFLHPERAAHFVSFSRLLANMITWQQAAGHPVDATAAGSAMQERVWLRGEVAGAPSGHYTTRAACKLHVRCTRLGSNSGAQPETVCMQECPACSLKEPHLNIQCQNSNVGEAAAVPVGRGASAVPLQHHAVTVFSLQMVLQRRWILSGLWAATCCAVSHKISK